MKKYYLKTFLLSIVLSMFSSFGAIKSNDPTDSDENTSGAIAQTSVVANVVAIDRENLLRDGGALVQLESSQIMEGAELVPFIKDFLRDFYHRLSELNPSRSVTAESFRGRENRRLDAMARLLVGDETCAAVAFDGENLLISTNRNTHASDRIKVGIKLLIKKGFSTRSCIRAQLVYCFSYNDSDVVRVLGEEIVINHQRGVMTPNKTIVRSSIPSSFHMIPFLGDLPIDMNLSLADRFTCPDVDVLTGDVEVDTPYEFNFLYSPLRRRSEVLIDHMSLIAKVKQKKPPIYGTIPLRAKHEPRQAYQKKQTNITRANNKMRLDHISFLERLTVAIEQSRQRMLMQSLSWEAAKWFQDLKPGKQKKINYDRDTFNAEVNEFIEELNKRFEVLKTSSEPTLLGTPVVRKWCEQIINDIKSSKFKGKVPQCILSDPDFFMGRVWRYFVDLVKLEDFVNSLDEKDPLLRGLLHEEGPLVPKRLPKIVDDLKDGTHAEMRILWHTREKKVPYIATSLLCCAHCSTMMQGLGVEGVSGGHGRAYDKWWLADELRSPAYLEAFLGKALYDRFSTFSHSLKLSFGTISQQEFLIMAIERIACLTDGDLKALGVTAPRVFAKGIMMADESDDEVGIEDEQFRYDTKEGVDEENEGIMVERGSERLPYRIVPIDKDGNCMYSAVLQGAQREHTTAPLPSNPTAFTVDSLRLSVANEIEENYGQYFDTLVAQLITVIRDEDYFGLPVATINQLKGLHKQVKKWQRSGLTASEITEKLKQIIETKGIVESYRNMICLNQTWGGNVELGIMSQVLGVQIVVHRRTKEGDPPINNSASPNAPSIHLDYNGDHYNLITEVY